MNPFRNRSSRRGGAAPAATNADAAAASSTLPPTNYQSFHDARQDPPIDNDDSTTTSTEVHGQIEDSSCEYRGFSTSVHDMFTNIANERVDCCALTCCGILQNDRDRYLLQGVAPPSPFKRFYMHVVLPLCIFCAAGYVALRIPNRIVNQILSTGLILILVFYFYLQCLKGRTKRIEIRKDLLWTKYQLLQQPNRGRGNRRSVVVHLEQERPDDEDEDQVYYLGQTQHDMGCVHPCCLVGCYAQDYGPSSSRAAPDNLCGCLAQRFLAWQCCGMQVQCCGMYGIAQEAREVEHVLLPASYRRIDYITMQPVTEYYPAIYRHTYSLPPPATEDDDSSEVSSGATRCGKWLPPLSRLSIRLLQSMGLILLVFFVWSFLGPVYWTKVVHANVKNNHLFHFADWLLLCATGLQAVGLLALLAWLANRPKPSRLSMDAMIKFFASGFLLSTSLAVFWECVLGLLVKTFVSLILAIAGVDVVSDPETDAQQTWGDLTWGFASTVISAPLFAAKTTPQDFLKTYGNSHPIFYSIYIFVHAFFLAAMVEEICKYFGYRMVEHPDFFTKQDLDGATRVVYGATEDEALEDGRRPRRDGPDYSNQQTSVQAQGAAITIAMIAVAMGFTCCENLVYIFVYSGSTVKMELAVLIARTFFPVHPIAAAIQSVGVCQRDLESSRTTQLGRIILPAVIFHGGYDFFLLWIDFLVSRDGVYADEADDDTTAFDDDSAVILLASFCISVLAMLLALCYYFRQARKQRERLIAMDRQEAVGSSRLI